MFSTRGTELVNRNLLNIRKNFVTRGDFPKLALRKCHVADFYVQAV